MGAAEVELVVGSRGALLLTIPRDISIQLKSSYQIHLNKSVCQQEGEFTPK